MFVRIIVIYPIVMTILGTSREKEMLTAEGNRKCIDREYKITIFAKSPKGGTVTREIDLVV